MAGGLWRPGGQGAPSALGRLPLGGRGRRAGLAYSKRAWRCRFSWARPWSRWDQAPVGTWAGGPQTRAQRGVEAAWEPRLVRGRALSPEGPRTHREIGVGRCPGRRWQEVPPGTAGGRAGGARRLGQARPRGVRPNPAGARGPCAGPRGAPRARVISEKLSQDRAHL